MKNLAELNIGRQEIENVLDISSDFEKFKSKYQTLPNVLQAKTLAMIFEEKSLRTRAAFEVAMKDLGGNAIYLSSEEVRVGRKASKTEHHGDFGGVISGFVDAVLCRIYDNEYQSRLARHFQVPYVNGMCDLHHPTQALCDFFTIRKRFGSLDGLKIAFVGDATNVAYSVAQGMAQFKSEFHLACPIAYEPLISRFRLLPNFHYHEDPVEAVREADVVLADAWFPMNVEYSNERIQELSPYRVTSELTRNAASRHIFMHNLPAKRGEEVSEDVIDGPHSVVVEEAVSRLAIARGLLYTLLKQGGR